MDADCSVVLFALTDQTSTSTHPTTAGRPPQALS
jgi:hypothetical protein